MKLKFNWGTGIVLALIIMISGMSYLVSIAIRQDYDLVDKDYYQKSVDYQQHIEKVKNTSNLESKIFIQQSNDTLKLTFPNLDDFKNYTGIVHFYSPVAENRDLTNTIKIDMNYEQFFDLKSLKNGRYEVKIDWSANKVDYYQEDEILVGR